MIYFIQALDGGPIKIGTSTRLTQRLKHLESVRGCKLRVLAVIDGGIPEERAIHRLFKHHRISKDAEWFRPGGDLMSVIATEGRDWDGTDEREARPRSRSDAIHRQHGLTPGTAIGPLIAKNLCRLGHFSIVPRTAEIARTVKDRTGITISRQRISALTNAVRVEPETIALLAKGLGVKPEELTRDD